MGTQQWTVGTATFTPAAAGPSDAFVCTTPGAPVQVFAVESVDPLTRRPVRQARRLVAPVRRVRGARPYRSAAARRRRAPGARRRVASRAGPDGGEPPEPPDLSPARPVRGESLAGAGAAVDRERMNPAALVAWTWRRAREAQSGRP